MCSIQGRDPNRLWHIISLRSGELQTGTIVPYNTTSEAASGHSRTIEKLAQLVCLVNLAYGRFRATYTCIRACAQIDQPAVELLFVVVELVLQVKATMARYCRTVVVHAVPQLSHR